MNILMKMFLHFLTNSLRKSTDNQRFLFTFMLIVSLIETNHKCQSLTTDLNSQLSPESNLSGSNHNFRRGNVSSSYASGDRQSFPELSPLPRPPTYVYPTTTVLPVNIRIATTLKPITSVASVAPTVRNISKRKLLKIFHKHAISPTHSTSELLSIPINLRNGWKSTEASHNQIASRSLSVSYHDHEINRRNGRTINLTDGPAILEQDSAIRELSQEERTKSHKERIIRSKIILQRENNHTIPAGNISSVFVINETNPHTSSFNDNHADISSNVSSQRLASNSSGYQMSSRPTHTGIPRHRLKRAPVLVVNQTKNINLPLPDLCTPNPCLSGGTCNEITGGIVCRCPSGVYGDRCEYTSLECVGNGCLNGGTCIADSQTTLGYKCICPFKYTGTFCQTEDQGSGAEAMEGIEPPAKLDLSKKLPGRQKSLLNADDLAAIIPGYKIPFHFMLWLMLLVFTVVVSFISFMYSVELERKFLCNQYEAITMMGYRTEFPNTQFSAVAGRRIRNGFRITCCCPLGIEEVKFPLLGRIGPSPVATPFPTAPNVQAIVIK